MLALQTALTAFRRSPLLSALSVTTIAFSLFAFGLFGLVALNIKNALTRVEERVEIRAFIAGGTSVETIATAADEIAKFPQVAKVDVVTQSQALERARTELGEFKDVFESEFLPASLDVKLKPGFRDPASVKAVAAQIQELSFVDDIRFGEEWITQLYRIRNIAGVVGAALGLAFAAVLVLIYILVTGWFQSFVIPLTIMTAIPFSLVGILPAHGAMGAFFTATSMIGFIAGAGIVVRNSIILVDFIQLRLKQGMP